MMAVDGALEISIEDDFLCIETCEYERKIRLWPEPIAWDRPRDSADWQEVSPQLSLTKQMGGALLEKASISIPVGNQHRTFYEDLNRRRAIFSSKGFQSKSHQEYPYEVADEFLGMGNYLLGRWKEIPEKIAYSVVEHQPCQWEMLWALGRFPYFNQLRETNYGLSMALASAEKFVPGLSLSGKESFVGELLLRPQHQIALALGFKPEKRAAKLLKKCVRRSAIKTLMLLRDVVLDPVLAHELAHLPAITTPILEFMIQYRNNSLIDPSFYRSFANYNPLEWHFHCVSTTEFLLEATRNQRELKLPLKDLQSISHQRDEDKDRFLKSSMKMGRFPSPPFKGNKQIRPIQNPAALYDEGKKMIHCAATYASIIARGEGYFYHMKHPEPSTWLIIPDPERPGCWMLQQGAGPKNKTVLPETKQQFLDWLDAENKRGS